MKKLISYLFVPLLLLSACDAWLDIVPEEDMTTLDTEFETRSTAEDWLRSCYMFLQSTVPSISGNEAFLGADEFVAGNYMRSMLDYYQKPYFTAFPISSGMQNSLDPYNDYWLNKEGNADNILGRADYYTAINLCNIFIGKIDQIGRAHV